MVNYILTEGFVQLSIRELRCKSRTFGTWKPEHSLRFLGTSNFPRIYCVAGNHDSGAVNEDTIYQGLDMPQKKLSKHNRFGDREGQCTGSPWQISCWPNVASKWLQTSLL
ncbi:hypothetical protein NPIL_77741 [Nephila pilipes]|uniref:Calcineurin-like phosphoesterase domain-containing protein n=1 Tax=Nephila pilipes TaxID=299642 RepID=A0A8X6UF68_NEPPI|nr:hypothetical protein NPIL_77741 [Nephila pilipes]